MSTPEKIYPISSDKHMVEPSEGQAYSVTELPTSIDGRHFRTRLLSPEEPLTDAATLLAYGMGANSVVHEDEVDAMAREGLPVLIQDDPRKQKLPGLSKIVTSGKARNTYFKHKLNPLIFPSMVLSRIMDETEHYTDEFSGFVVKGHSKGGLTASMAGAYDARVNGVVLDAPAGVVRRNAFMNHTRNPNAMVIGEAMPLAMQLRTVGNVEENTERALKHFKDDPERAFREIAFLMARTPDIRRNLQEIKNRDKKIGIALISHEFDGFFLRSDMDEAALELLHSGLIDVYERLDGTRHVNPNLNAEPSAHVYKGILGKLALLKA